MVIFFRLNPALMVGISGESYWQSAPGCHSLDGQEGEAITTPPQRFYLNRRNATKSSTVEDGSQRSIYTYLSFRPKDAGLFGKELTCNLIYL